jgi:hypothetical protein
MARLRMRNALTIGTEEQLSADMTGEVVEMRGLEPLTPAMRTRCSSS